LLHYISFLYFNPTFNICIFFFFFFSKTIYIFKSAILHKPESLTESLIIKKSRIKHHFYIVTSAIVVFVEVKKKLITRRKKLNVLGGRYLLSVQVYPNTIFLVVEISGCHNTDPTIVCDYVDAIAGGSEEARDFRKQVVI
jgi:hypothetical protein